MSWGNIWDRVDGVRVVDDTYLWRYYEMLIGDYDFKGKKILEIGSGTGINTVRMAMKGARVTFLDMSQEALDLARKNMDSLGLKGEYVKGSVFDFSDNGRFDLVHSEGVVEHFLSKERQRIIDIHADSLKRGGKVVIMVPNSSCIPYRVGKYLAELSGAWIFGNEYPYTGRELLYRMRRAGLDTGKIIGGEGFVSATWLLAPFVLKSGRLYKMSLEMKENPMITRMNYNNFFANRWGRVIGCVGVKG